MSPPSELPRGPVLSPDPTRAPDEWTNTESGAPGAFPGRGVTLPLVSGAAGTATGRDDTGGRVLAQAATATVAPTTGTRRGGRLRHRPGTGRRRPVLGVVVLAAVAAGCSATPSASSSTSSMPSVASGDVTCAHITGGISFSPPLTSTGSAAQQTRISLTATGCTSSASSAPVVSRGTAEVTIPSTTSACSGVLTLRSVALAIHWTPATIRPSTVTFPGYNIVSTPTGSAGFSFPSSGGSASVVGSFAGSDRGAASTAALYFDPSVTQIQAVCKSSGLASLPVTSGTVTLR